MPALTGEFRPSGLTIGGKITSFTINDSTWTKLPPSPLAERQAMAIQNISATEFVINYDSFGPLPGGYVGIEIAPRSERFYSVTADVNIYAKAQSGTITIRVEELA